MVRRAVGIVVFGLIAAGCANETTGLEPGVYLLAPNPHPQVGSIRISASIENRGSSSVLMYPCYSTDVRVRGRWKPVLELGTACGTNPSIEIPPYGSHALDADLSTATLAAECGDSPCSFRLLVVVRPPVPLTAPGRAIYSPTFTVQ